MGKRYNYGPKGEYRGYSSSEPKSTMDQVTDNHCFVATAVYGDVNAQPLDMLRHYRDNVLMQNPIGRAFVNVYYSGIGEKIADFINSNVRFAIPAIRRGLDGLIRRHATGLQK